MKTDILIIGGGLAARRAASKAQDHYSVTLIHDGAGASPYVHGLNVPLHENDSPELFLNDTLESGQHQNSPKLAKALVNGSLAIKQELAEKFDKSADGTFDLLKPLGASVPRVAGIEGKTGAVLLAELRRSKKYTELSGTRALSLIKCGDTVIGANVFDREKKIHFPIYAKAVLIATGGFGGIFRFSTNSADIGGDGAAMAYEAGASLADMEFIQYEPTAATAPPALVGKSIITTMLYEGAVIRNGRGERFMDERVNKDVLSAGISREIQRGGGTENNSVFFDMTAVPGEMLEGKYRDYYLRYKNQGIDIKTTPVEIAPAPHTTMGGIVIDDECKTTVEGLFAAGEAAGGIHGANRLGGNAGLEVLVFGDIAGESIVRYLDEKINADAASDNASEDSSVPDMSFDSKKMREDLFGICDTALGVVKIGIKLEEGLHRVKEIVKKASEHKESFEAMRLYNDALVIKLVISAALARSESIGSHVRDDGTSPITEKYRIILQKENNDLTVTRQTII